MKIKFLLARVKGRAAWIILILFLLTLPTSAVFAVRTSFPQNEIATPNGLSLTPPLDRGFTQSDNVPVTYDPINGAIEQGGFPECKNCAPEETDYYKPDKLQSPPWPKSATVKVVATWPSTDMTECSGVLVDQAAVLTAAHCVFTHTEGFCGGEDSCWATGIHIINYPDTGEQHSDYTQVLTWTAWTENQDFDFDLAGIKLDQPLGSEVGWLGFGYNNDDQDQFFPNKTFEYTSYTGDTLETWTGPFARIEANQFFTDTSSNFEQTGAGAHRNEYNHIVYSVLSHQIELEGEVKTAHTRITPEKFFALRDWINGNLKKLNFNFYLPIFVD